MRDIEIAYQEVCKPRETHRCWLCGQPIAPHTECLEQTIVVEEYDPERVWAHLGCDALYWETPLKYDGMRPESDELEDALRDVNDRATFIKTAIKRLASHIHLHRPPMYSADALLAELPRLLERYAPFKDTLTLDLFDKEPTP